MSNCQIGALLTASSREHAMAALARGWVRVVGGNLGSDDVSGQETGGWIN